MERYRNFVRIEQFKELVRSGRTDEALELADQIDCGKVKSTSDLNLLANLYLDSDMLKKAGDCLNEIYKRSRTRGVLMQLVNLSIRLKNVREAEKYYLEYKKLARDDFYVHIFRYNIDKIEGKPYPVLIESLEKLRAQEYIEEWAYELAKLYHKSGEKEKCIDECENLIVWFGEGEYVERAKALKAYYLGELNIGGEQSSGSERAADEMTGEDADTGSSEKTDETAGNAFEENAVASERESNVTAEYEDNVTAERGNNVTAEYEGNEASEYEGDGNGNEIPDTFIIPDSFFTEDSDAFDMQAEDADVEGTDAIGTVAEETEAEGIETVETETKETDAMAEEAEVTDVAEGAENAEQSEGAEEPENAEQSEGTEAPENAGGFEASEAVDECEDPGEAEKTEACGNLKVPETNEVSVTSGESATKDAFGNLKVPEANEVSVTSGESATKDAFGNSKVPETKEAGGASGVAGIAAESETDEGDALLMALLQEETEESLLDISRALAGETEKLLNPAVAKNAQNVPEAAVEEDPYIESDEETIKALLCAKLPVPEQVPMPDASFNFEKVVFKDYAKIEEDSPVPEGMLRTALENNNDTLLECFGYLAYNSNLRTQIIKNLEILFNPAIRNKCLIVTGGKQSGRNRLIKGITKILAYKGILKDTEMALTSGDKFNLIKFEDNTSRLEGCCLVIDKAGRLSGETVKRLLNIAPKLVQKTVVVLTDARSEINNLLRDNRELNGLFSNRIHIPDFGEEDVEDYIYFMLQKGGYEITVDAAKELGRVIKKIVRISKDGTLARADVFVKKLYDVVETRNANAFIAKTIMGSDEHARQDTIIMSNDVILADTEAGNEKAFSLK